jgi:hypothetical protein
MSIFALELQQQQQRVHGLLLLGSVMSAIAV